MLYCRLWANSQPLLLRARLFSPPNCCDGLRHRLQLTGHGCFVSGMFCGGVVRLCLATCQHLEAYASSWCVLGAARSFIATDFDHGGCLLLHTHQPAVATVSLHTITGIRINLDLQHALFCSVAKPCSIANRLQDSSGCSSAFVLSGFVLSGFLPNASDCSFRAADVPTSVLTSLLHKPAAAVAGVGRRQMHPMSCLTRSLQPEGGAEISIVTSLL